MAFELYLNATKLTLELTRLTKSEAFRATQGAWQDFARLYEQDFPAVLDRKIKFKEGKMVR